MASESYSCDRVVPIDEEPRHQLVIANEYVRAFAVEIAPHERTLCHRHPNDYLLYVASDAEIISAAPGEEPKRLSYADGHCELSSAGLVHVVENLRGTPFRNVVVELLARAGALRRGPSPILLRGDASVTALFEDERAAVFHVQIEPGAEMQIAGPAVVAAPYGNKLGPDAIGDIQVVPNSVSDLVWIPRERDAVLWGCWDGAERAIVFQLGRADDEAFSAVPATRKPLRSLRAHADQPESEL